MIILGVDPGSHITGYGVIEKCGPKWSPLTYGCIKAPARGSLDVRLLAIYQGLNDVIQKINPDVMSIENVFFAKNASSALKLGQCRGVLILAAAQMGIDVFEYTPLQMKQAVTGYGQATKEQVQKMIISLLGIKEKLTLDTSDALGLALCHAYTQPQREKLKAMGVAL
jgi:crossover junction endodeoxyribonuclease RuvC